MAIFTKKDLLSLNYLNRGFPYANIIAFSSDVTDKTDIINRGFPFYVVGALPYNAYVKVAGSWKQASVVYVKDGVWKRASSSIYVSDELTWKTSGG